MKLSRIPTLDGIRGIAILMVLAGHTAENYQPLDATLRHRLDVLANSGGGVRLFFVLSGYLITHLLLQEQATTGTISVRAFYRRRIARIFPAFYVFLLGALAVNLARPAPLYPGPWIAAGTFTWNYAFLWTHASPAVHWDLGHLWTLALEQQFYLVWPLLLVAAGTRRAGWIAAGLIAWCPVARVAGYFLFPAQRGALGMMFHTAVDSLMVGCCAAMLMQSAAVRAWLARLPAAAMWGLGAWFFLVSPLLGSEVRGYAIIAGFTLDAAAAALLIAKLHHAPGPWLGALLSRGPLPWLGLISYSLYLWQQLLFSASGGLGSGRLAAPWAAAVAAATLSYWLVERPILRFNSRRSAAPRLAPVLPS